MLKWIAALVLFPSLAVAQNCDDPQVQYEMNACAQIDWEEADIELNAAYKRARVAMRRIDALQPAHRVGAVDTLRDAQRAWIKFRDAACEAESFLFRDGSMEPLILASCMADLTRRRTNDLRNLAEYE
ncbi:MAG: lysozyme inhibitor LprI family protein [Pseudomonadota bacterium]